MEEQGSGQMEIRVWVRTEVPAAAEAAVACGWQESMAGYTGRTPLWSSMHPSAVLPAHRGGMPTDSANCSAVSGPAWLMSTLGSLAHVDESPGSDQCCHASLDSLEAQAGQPGQQGQQGQQGRGCVPELAGLAPRSGEVHEAFQGKSAGEVSLQSLNVPSLDGFGSVAGSSLPAHGLSWEHILNKLDVGAADHLTLIVMEHAKCGTLLSAIRVGLPAVRRPWGGGIYWEPCSARWAATRHLTSRSPGRGASGAGACAT
ncbi:hypothetical protein HaLaN_25799 [Haematococcus lacustris]|uniref:Uncharacterized protein n=1 Tax=Haematococcus lacustris TaxID=44745 RepID=A0A6A0A4A0_HAELA|nr:hypothetical protein HaLaN_25799 [Haematococcus lacustris]